MSTGYVPIFFRLVPCLQNGSRVDYFLFVEGEGEGFIFTSFKNRKVSIEL